MHLGLQCVESDNSPWAAVVNGGSNDREILDFTLQEKGLRDVSWAQSLGCTPPISSWREPYLTRRETKFQT